MRRLVAVLTALVTVGATGCFGSAIAAADDTQAGWTPDHGAPGDGPPPLAPNGSPDWIVRSSAIPRVRFRDTPWNGCFQG
jgi:hypothetical protein